MSGSIEQVVETKFMLKDELSSKLGSIEEHLTKLHETTKKEKKEVSELKEKFEAFGEGLAHVRERVTGLAETFGIGLGIGELTHKFIEANSSAEDLTRTMGALVSANYRYGKMDPAENFKRSMVTGKEMYEEFQDAAIKFGLSTDKLAQSASILTPGLAQAKVGTHEMTEMVSKLGLIARNANVDLSGASTTLSEFLTSGTARQENLLVQILGLKASTKNTAVERVEMLKKAMGKFSDESLKGATTFSDRVNMLKASMQKIMELGGAPLFEAANEQAKELIEWLKKNKEQVIQTAKEVAGDLAAGLKFVASVLKFAGEHALVLKDALIGLAAAKGVFGLFNKIDEVSKNFGLFSSGTEAIEANGARIGGSIGLGAKATMVAASFEVGWAIGTAIDKMLESTDWWKKLWTPDAILKQDAEFKKEAQLSAEQKAGARADKDRVIEDKVADIEGNDMSMGSRDAVITLLAKIATNGKSTRRRWGMLFDSDVLSKFGSSTNRMDLGAHGRLSVQDVLAYAYAHKLMTPPAPKKPGAADGEHALDRPPTNVFNNARFDIKQEFAQGFDPDRIAVALTNGIAKLGERKLQSPFAPAYAVR